MAMRTSGQCHHNGALYIVTSQTSSPPLDSRTSVSIIRFGCQRIHATTAAIVAPVNVICFSCPPSAATLVSSPGRQIYDLQATSGTLTADPGLPWRCSQTTPPALTHAPPPPRRQMRRDDERFSETSMACMTGRRWRVKSKERNTKVRRRNSEWLSKTRPAHERSIAYLSGCLHDLGGAKSKATST
ncbi:hypothetical protein BKA81DRAFT_65306 [Phyllosticta paracitricarpa]